MSQQIKVARKIEFMGAASYLPNIKGNICPERIIDFDNFQGDLLTDEWALNTAHGGTVAIVAISGGAMRLSSSTTDNDKAEAARGIMFKADRNCAIEARIKVDNITTVGMVMGFADAASYSDNQVAFEIDGSTIVDRCSNGVAWVFDTDATAKYWHYCNTKANEQAGTSIAIAPVAATWERFRIALDKDGNATFYRNGVLKGHKASAVTDSTLLCPYFAVISRVGTAARVMDAGKYMAWQDDEI